MPGNSQTEMQTNKKSKTPWPTKAAMEQIYEKHLWGGIEMDFYSGEGSHDPTIVEPYIDCVSNFLQWLLAQLGT